MRLTESELTDWGRRVGAEVGLPAFLALRGDLGAGKSVLARAIARGAGVDAVMPSPTYNLVFRYEGERADVVHMDLYRLDRPDEVWELGWREFGVDRDLVLVEWPERAESLLPADRWDIELAVATPATRTVRLRRHGNAPTLPPMPAGGSGDRE